MPKHEEKNLGPWADPDELGESMSDLPRLFSNATCEANALAKRSLWPEAIEAFTRALCYQPRNVTLLSARSHCRFLAADNAGALADVRFVAVFFLLLALQGRRPCGCLTAPALYPPPIQAARRPADHCNEHTGRRRTRPAAQLLPRHPQQGKRALCGRQV